MARELKCKFEALYDLGLQLLTAAPDSDLGRLTVHHCISREEAEMVLRSAVLQRTMRGEEPSTRWGVLRVFMRNLVNRAQSPMPAQEMESLLNDISSKFQDELLRTKELADRLEISPRLRQSLRAVLEHGHAPGNCNDYIQWLTERIEEYRDVSVASIDPQRVLHQLRQVACDRPTKIPNVGIALAANLFADLGIRVVGKPDLHVIPTMAWLMGVDTLKPEACIAEIIRISQNEAPRLQAGHRFDWLDGGLYPRDLDRMIYLIGSDNFRLNGTQRKHCAPKRRQRMIEVLSQVREFDRAVHVRTQGGGSDESKQGTPAWLKKWKARSRFSAADFFASRVVFYPGSGTDGQPVQFFGSRHAAHCYAYVDYGITRDLVKRELNEHPFAGYRSVGRRELKMQDLTPNGWIPSIKPEVAPEALQATVPPYAFLEILERQPDFDDTHGPQRLAILILCADGVAAYDSLFCQATATAPFAVVLQDHGFGGNWTTFGRGGALENLASITGQLPKFLLVAENTIAWAGYEAVDGDILGGGGMHGFDRQLWQRVDHPADVQRAPPRLADANAIPSAHELFFAKISNAPTASALIARVTAICEELHVTVHCTHTDGGDLRVWVDRPAPNRPIQNAITMDWRPQKGYFSCQVVPSPEECVDLGMSPESVWSNAGALRCRLNVRPGVDDEAFLSLVSLSIARFREQ